MIKFNFLWVFIAGVIGAFFCFGVGMGWWGFLVAAMVVAYCGLTPP